MGSVSVSHQITPPVINSLGALFISDLSITFLNDKWELMLHENIVKNMYVATVTIMTILLVFLYDF